MEKLEFGYKCKDIVTGFEGIVETRGIFITGCDRIKLVKGNAEEDKQWFDVPMLKIVDKGIYEELQDTNSNKYDNIEEALYDFGTYVKDKISDFEGTIIGKSISISGDICYGVTPKYEKNSKNNDAVWYDEGRIQVIETKKEEIKITNIKRTGGAVPNLKIR